LLLKEAGQEIAGTPHWVGVAALRDAGAASPATTSLAADRPEHELVDAQTRLDAHGTGRPPGGTTTTSSFSFTGQPALSLPLHQSEDGLPVGVQLVARRGDDERLLQPAEDLQRVTDWTTRRPPSS